VRAIRGGAEVRRKIVKRQLYLRTRLRSLDCRSAIRWPPLIASRSRRRCPAGLRCTTRCSLVTSSPESSRTPPCTCASWWRRSFRPLTSSPTGSSRPCFGCFWWEETCHQGGGY